MTTLFPARISLVSLDVGFSEQSRLSRLSPRHHLIAHRSAIGGVVHNVSLRYPSRVLIGPLAGTYFQHVLWACATQLNISI